MTDEFAAGPERQPTVSKSAEHAPVRSVELRADWRARKWARERMATRCQEDGFPEVAEAYRRGDRDEFLRDDIEAYRAGAAASADRIKELEAEVRELMDALNATPQHKTQKAILARIAHKADLAPYRHDDTVAQQRRAPTND